MVLIFTGNFDFGAWVRVFFDCFLRGVCVVYAGGGGVYILLIVVGREGRSSSNSGSSSRWREKWLKSTRSPTRECRAGRDNNNNSSKSFSLSHSIICVWIGSNCIFGGSARLAVRRTKNFLLGRRGKKHKEWGLNNAGYIPCV